MRRILPLLFLLGACSSTVNVDRTASGFDAAKYEADLSECRAIFPDQAGDAALGVLGILGGTILVAAGLIGGGDIGGGSLIQASSERFDSKHSPTAVSHCMEVRGYTMKAD